MAQKTGTRPNTRHGANVRLALPAPPAGCRDGEGGAALEAYGLEVGPGHAPRPCTFALTPRPRPQLGAISRCLLVSSPVEPSGGRRWEASELALQLEVGPGRVVVSEIEAPNLR